MSVIKTCTKFIAEDNFYYKNNDKLLPIDKLRFLLYKLSITEFVPIVCDIRLGKPEAYRDKFILGVVKELRNYLSLYDIINKSDKFIKGRIIRLLGDK